MKVRLLIVEDDPELRALMRATLAREGYDITEAANGEEGVTAFQNGIFDIVLTDVLMPRMDGFDLIQTLRRLPEGEHIPILVMTGLEDYDSINRAFECGATDFFLKPYNRSLLNYRLRYILRAKKTAEALRRSERRLASAQRIAKLGYWELYLTDDRMICSPEMLNLLGINDGPAIENLRDFRRYMQSEDREIFNQAVKVAGRTHTGYVIEHRMQQADGSVISVQQFAEYRIDSNTREEKLVGTLQDITERKRAEKQIEHLSFYDKLTGLPNRIYLRKNLHRAIAEAGKRQCYLAVMMLSLDNFENINGTLGYAAGDQLLLEVKQRLLDCVRRNPRPLPGHETAHVGNMLAHLGGDDFVILLADVLASEDIVTVVRRVNAVLAETFAVSGNEVSVTSSIGISIYPDDGHDGDTLMKHASTALKDAREEGGNHYKFYTKAMNVRAFERLSLEASLRKAIERKQFELFYQPKVAMQDDCIIGAEALIRWRHPDLGLVSPADFISIAEVTGMVLPIGEWVLEETCRQLAVWQQQGRGFRNISINLSARHLMLEHLYDRMHELLQRTGITPATLGIEITENTLLEDTVATIERLNELKRLGLDISIDDFGTGYSSLSYLKKLPVSTVKIDQSFIKGIPADTDDGIIVEAIIALSRSLGLKVVAEGVETRAQYAFLKEKGCDYVQGYYLSPPLAADDFVKWCEAYDARSMTG